MRRTCSLLLAALAAAAAAHAQEKAPGLLPDSDRRHLARALDALNIGTNGLAFDRDHLEPRLVLPVARRALRDPAALAAAGEAALAVSGAGSAAGIWDRASDWLAAGTPTNRPALAPVLLEPLAWPTSVSPALVSALDRFAAACSEAAAWRDAAVSGIGADDRLRVAASFLGGALDAEDSPEARRALAAAGMPGDVLDRLQREGYELDAGPGTAAYLDILERVDIDALLRAARVLHAAAEELAFACAGIDAWPEGVVRAGTPWGELVIGTPGNDSHAAPALLVLDPGGDDRYVDTPGVANGLLGVPLAAIVDCAGNDTYEGNGALAPGAGVFGAAVIVDLSGRDRYRAAFAGSGLGVAGVGWVDDRAGDDIYTAGGPAQGAAVCGLGVLRDWDGNDLYQSALYSQGFAGCRAVGWLADVAGNDVYVAGGRHPDHERHEEHFLSLSQGFAIGPRPAAGGGVAVLADLAGNDIYQADVYGQGVAYWYAVGMLLDRRGHDTYTVWEYGQGSGIHLSAGLLADLDGNDRYSGYSLSQGNAHDFALGMLIERGGNDVYSAWRYSQGQGVNNALGMLVDAAGNDVYTARDQAQSQGRGHLNADRGYGSLSLLLDLGGKDRYSGPAADDTLSESEDDGIVYDVDADKQ
jgi:hypothetical protein